MRDWLRLVDPAFYHKEPYLLRAEAHTPRYTEEARVAARLDVLTADSLLHVTTAVVALAAFVAVTGNGDLDTSANLLTMWALAVLVVAAPCALPWWPQGGIFARIRQALGGTALVAVPTLWTQVDVKIYIVAALAGAALLATRGRGRYALLLLSVAALVGARMPAHLLPIAPLAGALAAVIGMLAVMTVARTWRRNPQVITWSFLAALLVAFAYTFAFDAPIAALHLPVEITAIAVAYLGVCIIAGRVRRADLITQPEGVLSLPQSIVPLLDRSHHHAIICWVS